MSLAAALRPLLALDGLVAVVVMTSDGLPVEMLGRGLRADVAAAEIAALGRVATATSQELQLGPVKNLTVELSQRELLLFHLGRYYLAVIIQAPSNRSLISAVIESVRPQLAELLGGAG